MASCEKFTTIFPRVKDNINGFLINSDKQTFLHKILTLEDSIIILESNIDLNVNQIDILGETFVCNYYDNIDRRYKEKNNDYSRSYFTSSEKIIKFIELLVKKNYNINYIDSNNRSIINLCFREHKGSYQYLIDYHCLNKFFQNKKINPRNEFCLAKIYNSVILSSE